MTAAYSQLDVRPRRPKDWLIRLGMMVYDPVFAFLRRLPFIVTTSKCAVMARNDDVREVMRRSTDFKVTYKANLNIVMGGAPFLLGQDGDDLSRDIAEIRRVMSDDDIPRLSNEAAALCAELVAASNGSFEVLDLVRAATQEVFCDYLGVTSPPGGNLQVTAMRCIELVLADIFKDPELHREAASLSHALRLHIDSLIDNRKAHRRAVGHAPIDDILDR